MKAISYDKLVQIYKVSKQIELMYNSEKNLRKNIESNTHLTIKEKVIMEMWLGLWNDYMYTEDALCKLFELTHTDFGKIVSKAKRRRVDHCGGEELKNFMD